MSRTKGPMALKDLKTYDVDDYPYLIRKKYGEDRYFQSFKKAQEAMLKELVRFRDDMIVYDRAGFEDCVAGLLDQVSGLSERGGTVVGVIDPHTGVKYQAELVKREAI